MVVLYRGTDSWSLVEEHRDLLGMWMLMRSEMYDGASPLIALYVMSSTLNRMRWWTGSQWSLTRTRVMWSRFLLSVMSHAAEFWADCSLAISQSGRPGRAPLQ